MDYLADKSALTRSRVAEVAQRLDDLSEQNRLVTCQMIDLELLYSARNADEYEAIRSARAGYRHVPVTADVCDQALALQRRLAEHSQHRRPIPDLLIAATALLNDLIVLHYDRDFEVIAQVCELRQEWVVPRWSADA